MSYFCPLHGEPLLRCSGCRQQGELFNWLMIAIIATTFLFLCLLLPLLGWFFR